MQGIAVKLCKIAHQQLKNRVSFGIMTSFIVNLCLSQIQDPKLKLRLIMASPAVFAFILMLAVFKCPESFRYYMAPESKHYNPELAFGSLLRLRNTKVRCAAKKFSSSQTPGYQTLIITLETSHTRSISHTRGHRARI